MLSAHCGPITGARSVCQLIFKISAPSSKRSRLLLVRIAGEPAATAAFRRLDARACEAKRLYVHPAYRRRGFAGDDIRPGTYKAILRQSGIEEDKT